MQRKNGVRSGSTSKDKPAVPAAEQREAGGKRAVLIVLTLVIAAALGVRLWHDHQAASAPPTLSAAEIERKAQAQPDNLQAQLDWGDLLAKNGRLQDAVPIFAHAARIAPQDARPYAWLGILAVQDHHPDIARVNFEQSVKIDPSQAEVWHALGELQAGAHSDHRAIDAYEHAVHLSPKDEIAWRQLGVLSIKIDQRARGHEALLQAVRLKPDDLTAQMDLGAADLTSGLLPEARQAFDTVLAHRPDDPEALVGAAEAAIQLDPSPANLSHTEQQVELALKSKPMARGHLVLGRIKLMERNYTAAAREFHRAYQLDRSQITAFTYLSQVYSGMHRPDLANQASDEFQKAYAKLHQRNRMEGSKE